ncbi:MAG: hypothetical protein IJS08_08600 [Victivallales bacterium]|nr:hypothetical protein [Victivallales bacterium]
MKRKLTIVGFTVCFMLLLDGCYSCARYEANVRPDTVKPSAAVSDKYRLDRIILAPYNLVGLQMPNEEEYVKISWIVKAFQDLGEKKLDSGVKMLDSYVSEVTKKEFLQLMKECENDKHFINFVKKFTKEITFGNQEVLKLLQAYYEAVEIDDKEHKQECKKTMISAYCGLKGLMKMTEEYKKAHVNDTDGLIKRLGYQNSCEFFEAIFRHEYNAYIRFCQDEKCTKMYYDAIQASLLNNYPNVFTNSMDATPITVLVSYKYKYETHSYDHGLLRILGFPITQKVEVTYQTRIVPNASGKNKDELWNEYYESRLEYPPAAQNSGAIRQRDMWTSCVLPISLLGIPGKTDWPKKREVFTEGTFAISPNDEKYALGESLFKDYNFVQPITFIQNFVFDPVCDGDIIAALIMRSLNKMAAAELK